MLESLRAYSAGRGADLFGTANLAPARAAIITQGGSKVGAFPRAVSLGMRLSDPVVDGHDPAEEPRTSQYWHHVYSVVTPALDVLANDVAEWLAHRGHRTLAIPASMPYDGQKLQGMFSHKLAAHLAGIGWVGKSCLLVTDEFGPRVRLVTVLTDAPLPVGALASSRCGKCRICVDACPVGAFTGTEFDEADDLPVRFDARRCQAYRTVHACGMCVAACPRGTARRVSDRAAERRG